MHIIYFYFLKEYPGATDRQAEKGTKKGFTKLVKVRISPMKGCLEKKI